MDHRIASAPDRPIVRAAVLLLATAMFAAAGISAVVAQTLSKPDVQQPKSASPSALAVKPSPVKRGNSCSQYGDGFVYIPASDTCVKVGGFVDVDAAVGHSR